MVTRATRTSAFSKYPHSYPNPPHFDYQYYIYIYVESISFHVKTTSCCGTRNLCKNCINYFICIKSESSIIKKGLNNAQRYKSVIRSLWPYSVRNSNQCHTRRNFSISIPKIKWVQLILWKSQIRYESAYRRMDEQGGNNVLPLGKTKQTRLVWGIW